MKRIIVTLILIVIVLLIGGYLYELGLKNGENAVSKKNENISLVGIWQANGAMGSGWADRYHFYPNGTFHFYPSEMDCQKEKVQLLGDWKIDDQMIVLTTKTRIVDTLTCDVNGFGHPVKQTLQELKKPEVSNKSLVNLGTLENDIYQSILISGSQHWKFSDDPTIYGDEKFPDK